MEFRSIHTVQTAENIQLKVELAGLANRLFAFLIDAVLMASLMGFALILFTLPTFLREVPEVGKTAIPLAMFLIMFGYNLFQEWLWNGKTIGKSLLGIRVVRDNSQPIGFWEALGRNLLRVIDVYLSGIGLLVMLFNRDEKRLGDFVTGTIVINDQAVLKPARPQPVVSDDTVSSTPNHQTIRNLSPEEAELLKAFRARRSHLFPEARQRITQTLCTHLSERLHQPVTTEAELDALLSSYNQQA